MRKARGVAWGRQVARLSGIAGLAIAAIAGVWLTTFQPRAQTARLSAASSDQAVPVTVTKVTLADVPIDVSGLGTVQPLNAVTVRTRVDGTLMQVPVTEGQMVKPGDLIAVIDPRPFKAALDQAMAKKQQDEAQLANARHDLARTSALAKQDFASRQQMDTQQAQVDQFTAQIAGDQAAIEAAQLNLSYCYITSPIPGRVGLRQIDPGNIVHASDATGILSIAQDQPISVVFTLPQQYLPAILKAMRQGKLPVTAYSGDDTTKLESGTLLTPDNAIDLASGTIKLKAVFPNTENALWPGQFVDAKLQLGVKHHVLTLPDQAVQHGPDGLFVYVVKPDSTVERVPVERETHDDVAVMTKGLQEGQVVVLRGQSRLDNGLRVTIEQAQS